MTHLSTMQRSNRRTTTYYSWSTLFCDYIYLITYVKTFMDSYWTIFFLSMWGSGGNFQFFFLFTEYCIVSGDTSNYRKFGQLLHNICVKIGLHVLSRTDRQVNLNKSLYYFLIFHLCHLISDVVKLLILIFSVTCNKY